MQLGIAKGVMKAGVGLVTAKLGLAAGIAGAGAKLGAQVVGA